MKRFSNFNTTITEGACVTSDVNPGNSLGQTGVSNHYTPVQNILVNIRNLFGPQLNIAAAIAEDGLSIKLHSSNFINKQEIEKQLSIPLYNGVCLKDYIKAQGLDKMTCVDLGQYFVVWFSPSDIKNAQPGAESQPCKESLQETENEMISIFENDEDEELEDITKTQIKKLIKKEDKVKAAKQFGILVAQQLELPEEYYFAGVKDQEGNESIALRWKYIKRRRHKKSTQSIRSLINIYGTGKDAVWVQDFDEKSYFKLPEEVEKIVKDILDMLGAKETKDPCQYEIVDADAEKEDKKDKEDKEKKEDKKEEKKEPKKEEKKESKSDTSNEEDTEDEASRGEGGDENGGLL